MMKFKYNFLFLPLLLAACAHAPQQAVQAEDPDEHVIDTSAVLPSMSGPGAAQSYPKIELSEQMLYTFLMADIAAQRGRTDLAAQAYLELAKATRDARVAQRAAQLSYESQQMEPLLDSLKLWQELEPQAVMPRQMLVSVLISGGKLEEARPYLSEFLAEDSKNTGHAFEQIYPLFGRNTNRLAVYKMLVELAKPYPGIAEVHWVLAQAAESAGLHDDALGELNQARALRPEWAWPVLLEARILQMKTPAQALSVEKQFLDVYPDDKDVRLSYARLLLDQKQYQDSRTQFQEILKRQPDNVDVAFAVALLSIQLGEFDRAEKELRRTLATGKKDGDTVHYYLAQLNEAKKNEAAALEEYRQVAAGDYVFPAHLRMAYLLGKAGKIKEAREVLHQAESRNNQQRAQLILTEAQILRDARQYDASFKVLSDGLVKQPDQPDLLYEAAMVADKQGKFATLEDMLRRLIKVAPDHAHAYNALGYAMLERNIRLDEAMKLIEKAYQLDPGDAAIMDSMGWGYFLQGNLDKSLTFMRRAYAAYPDPEIAAHLGEVLWKQGQQDEAKVTWQANLKKNPDSAALKAVIKKFLP